MATRRCAGSQCGLRSACARRGESIVTAESCTGGFSPRCLTDLPGSSDYFDRGWVTYANERQARGARRPGRDAQRHGAVSEAVALAMVRGALRNSGADHAVAVTGIAGPAGGSAAKPVGLVWIAWGYRRRRPQSRARDAVPVPRRPGRRTPLDGRGSAEGPAGLVTTAGGAVPAALRLFLRSGRATANARRSPRRPPPASRGFRPARPARQPARDPRLSRHGAGIVACAADRVGGQGPWPAVELDFRRLEYWAKPRWWSLGDHRPGRRPGVRRPALAGARAARTHARARPWRPHLTLARRVRGRRPTISPCSLAGIRGDEPAWRLALVESIRPPDGVRYRPLADWPLGEVTLSRPPQSELDRSG